MGGTCLWEVPGLHCVWKVPAYGRYLVYTAYGRYSAYGRYLVESMLKPYSCFACIHEYMPSHKLHPFLTISQQQIQPY